MEDKFCGLKKWLHDHSPQPPPPPPPIRYAPPPPPPPSVVSTLWTPPPPPVNVPLQSKSLCKNMSRAPGGANIIQPLSWGGGAQKEKIYMHIASPSCGQSK